VLEDGIALPASRMPMQCIQALPNRHLYVKTIPAFLYGDYGQYRFRGKCVVSICRSAGGAPFWLLDRSPRPVRETYTGRFGNQRRERNPTSPLALRLLLVRPGTTSRQRHEPPGACRRHASLSFVFVSLLLDIKASDKACAGDYCT